MADCRSKRYAVVIITLWWSAIGIIYVNILIILYDGRVFNRFFLLFQYFLCFVHNFDTHDMRAVQKQMKRSFFDEEI